MPSLDDTTRALWATSKPAIGLLATTGCSRAAAIDLSPEERAPFDAMSSAILAWWPYKRRPASEIFQGEFSACLDLYGNAEDHTRLDPSLEAAYHQMEAVRLLAPGTLSMQELGAQHDLDAESLIKLVRRLAKLTHSDLLIWRGRFEYLLSFVELRGSDAAWPELLAKTARMGFERPTRRIKELSKPLQELARASDLGGTYSSTPMGPKHAVTVQLGTTKRTAVLDEEQRASLLETIPWLV